MRKMLKKIFVSLLGTIIFGALYALLQYITERYVDIRSLLMVMVLYFLFMLVFRFIESKLSLSKD